MNILYITKIDGRPWVGPTYSISKQIEAQALFDSVFWYNLVYDGLEEGKENLKKWRKLDYYHDLKEYASGSIKNLPIPFNSPDFVVVEQAYPYAKDKIRLELTRGNIPYVIIPRGEFTHAAQSKKRLKN